MSGRIKPLNGDGTKRHSRRKNPKPGANRQHQVARRRKALRENPGTERLLALKAKAREQLLAANAAATAAATAPAS